MGECKDPVWLWTEIGKRCGLGEYFTMTTAEYLDLRLQTDYPMVTCLEPKVTYERLKKEKMIRYAAPEEPKWDPWRNADEIMDNESGRTGPTSRIPPTDDRFHTITPLTLRPIVENAVKQGMNPDSTLPQFRQPTNRAMDYDELTAISAHSAVLTCRVALPTREARASVEASAPKCYGQPAGLSA